jgi:hypothetical protein
MKKLVRFYARNRVNLITIEATGRKWPGDLSPVVTWKYFPVLHDESRDEVVAKRLRNINELIDFAHSWGIQVVMYTSEFNHEPDLYQRCPELMGLLPDTWKDGRHNYIRGCLCLSKNRLGLLACKGAGVDGGHAGIGRAGVVDRRGSK